MGESQAGVGAYQWSHMEPFLVFSCGPQSGFANGSCSADIKLGSVLCRVFALVLPVYLCLNPHMGLYVGPAMRALASVMHEPACILVLGAHAYLALESK